MRQTRLSIPFLMLAAALLTGCQSQPSSATQPAAGTPKAQPDLGPVAYINGQAVTWAQLQTPLIEAGGGQVLHELMMDRAVEERLAQRGLRVSEDDIEAEQQFLRDTLHRDPDQAQRLLNELRGRRGLGEWRYARLLWRNAGMRKLVRDDVVVTDELLRQAYDERYGDRYEARLIVVGSTVDANNIVRQARDGADFADLALRHSTDSSRLNGGLIPPISPADTTYPQAVRDSVSGMSPGDVSDPILLDDQFAILKLERKIDAQQVRFDDVRPELERLARRGVEQVQMQRLVRDIVARGNVTVLEPALAKSWAEHHKRMTQDGQ